MFGCLLCVFCSFPSNGLGVCQRKASVVGPCGWCYLAISRSYDCSIWADCGNFGIGLFSNSSGMGIMPKVVTWVRVSWVIVSLMSIFSLWIGPKIKCLVALGWLVGEAKVLVVKGCRLPRRCRLKIKVKFLRCRLGLSCRVASDSISCAAWVRIEIKLLIWGLGCIICACSRELIKTEVVVGLIIGSLIWSHSVARSEVELKRLLLLLRLWLRRCSKLKIKPRFELQILSWSLLAGPEVNILWLGCFRLLSWVPLVILLLLSLWVSIILIIEVVTLSKLVIYPHKALSIYSQIKLVSMLRKLQGVMSNLKLVIEQLPQRFLFLDEAIILS